MDIKDLLNAAMNKDAGAFESAFAQIMNGKMEAAVAAKYDSMFAEAKSVKEEDDEECEDDEEEMEDDEEEEDE